MHRISLNSCSNSGHKPFQCMEHLHFVQTMVAFILSINHVRKYLTLSLYAATSACLYQQESSGPVSCESRPYSPQNDEMDEYSEGNVSATSQTPKKRKGGRTSKVPLVCRQRKEFQRKARNNKKRKEEDRPAIRDVKLQLGSFLRTVFAHG